MKNMLHLFFSLFSVLLFSQQTHIVDFKTGRADISINPYKKEVKGSVTYDFKVLKNTDSVFIDARNMSFSSVMLHDKKIDFYTDGSKLWLIHPFRAETSYTVKIVYAANPEKAMYFTRWEFPGAKKQLWTQGQGKYTSNWIPAFDDVNEKVVFNLNITFNSDYEVISNGKLTAVSTTDSLKTWHYSMQEPMSSYLLAIAIGKYGKKTARSGKGKPLVMYYYPEDAAKVEPTYRHTKTIFDFLEEEIGVAYPWQNYKQVPVKDFLYAGMENTSATVFSDAYVVDSTAFADKNYVNVNAHELAHQWFGNLVTAKSGRHHWLQEGFATYYALLAEREIFGDDHYYRKLHQSAEQLMAMSDQGAGESLLDSKASSLTFYEKGAWALHILKEEIGAEAFRKAVKSYVLKHQFKTVDTDDLMMEMEQKSGKDLSEFTETWLKRKVFPEKAALHSLEKNEFLKRLLRMKRNKNENPPEVFSEGHYFPLNAEIIHQYKSEASEKMTSFYKKVLQSGLLKERQVVAFSLDTIPPALKADFESLLADKSYITIEKALYTLWASFPEDREHYLNTTRGITGFSDRNVEMLWLTLALATPNYEDDRKRQYYKTLSGYTSPVYAYEIRQNAFKYLYQLQLLSDNNLKDLVDACLHHTWQFAKASRSLLDMLLKNSAYKSRFQDIFSELSETAQEYLSKKTGI